MVRQRCRLAELQAACRACTVCRDEGVLPVAGPAFEGTASARLVLVGQAPGPVEHELRRPFMGRAGRELWRWMARAGFASEDEFRRLVYLTALARCFPGRLPSGAGDRRPPPRAIENCSRWLSAELALLQPVAILAVGQMAITRFLGPGALSDRVGRSFGSAPAVVPLPHPSGQSRWLNEPANRERLESALVVVGQLAGVRS